MPVRSARENIITALFNDVPDYVPCCPDISNMIPAKLTGKPFWDIYLKRDPPLGLAQVFAVNELGVDGFSDQGRLDPSPDYERKMKEIVIQNTGERGSIDTKTIFKTSHGDLRYKTRYYRNQPPVLIEKPIKDLSEDLPKVEEFFDPAEVQNFGVEYYSLVKEKMGDKGVVSLNVPVPGLHWLHGNLEGGLESAVKIYYEQPDLVKEICNILHSYIIEYVKKGLTFNIDAIQLGASGLLHFQSPQIIRELSLLTMKEVASLARLEGIPCHLHACGNEKALVELAAYETDITSVEPFEMPPMGDCNLASIKQEFGKRIGLKGNIHTIDVMFLGSPPDVDNAVKSCINDAAYNGGYILSTGDQCPAETPIKNLIAMVKTTQKVVRRVVPPLVSEIHIFEFRKKVVELGQRIGASEKDVEEWHSWLLRQTDKYQKAQIDGDFYKTMLSRFQNHYLLRIIGFKMQMHEKQALDEIRTLIDAILTGKTKLILDRAPKAEISIQDVKPLKPSKLSKLLVELLKASSRLVSSNKEVKEWHEWFLQKTDLYQKSQLDEETYKVMLKRSQNFLRSKASYSDKMQFAEVQALDEMQALIDAILARYDEHMSKDSEKKPTSHAAPERQEKLCPSCGASIYPRQSKYCKYCGLKLKTN